MHPSRYKFSNAFGKKPLGTYIKDAALHEPKRSMSNSRLTGTVLTTIGAIFLCYTSLFYIPALFKIDMILGTSTSMDDGTELQTNPNSPWYTPAVNFLRLKRGYFQAGSPIKAAYNSSPGTKITLYYRQCSGLPIIEVYSCVPGPVHKFEAEGHQGYVEIPVHKNGFYSFSQKVEYKSENFASNDFVILWGR